MKAKRNFRTSRGFTLIELLAVIAIVGILTAILIPAIGKVRTNAMRTESISNLRNIYGAIVMYSNEKQGQFPNSWVAPNEETSREQTNWRVQITKDGHLGEPDARGSGDVNGYSVLGSPIQHREAAAFTVDKDPPRMATYGMNALLTQLGASDNSKFFNSGKFLSPARTMLISSGESGNQQWFGTTVAPWKSPTHTDGTIEVLYADGHAEAMPLEDWPTTPGPRESDAWYFWNAIEGK